MIEMKKGFKFYIVVWLIALALFNVIVFATPNEMFGKTKITGAFRAGYIFITLSFIGQLICAYFALKPKNSQKIFYRLPLITIGYTSLIIALIAGALTMVIPNLPVWVGIVICAIVLAVSAISVVKATVAAEIVSEKDDEVKAKTAFIKNLTSDAQSLMSRASDVESKALCKKVFEAVRYSDPMSSDSLNDIEVKITREFENLSRAITEKKNAEAEAEELLRLISDRNIKCKIFK